jgi:hypothetical protein
MSITVGTYYENQKGEIAYSYMWNKQHLTLRYEDDTVVNVTENEIGEWKERRDLQDYPNSKDPVLPYVFDLFFDLKRMSDLKDYINRYGKNDDLEEIIKNHNIKGA